MKLALKILGVLVLILLVAGISFFIFIEIRGIPKYEGKAPEVSFKYDSAMVATGARIGRLLCKECHLNKSNMKLTGAYMPDVAQFGKAWSRNITHDKDFGIGDWSDGDLMYLFRTGIKRSGQYAPPWMPKFAHMSDYDLKSIVAWLRSNDPMLEATAIADTESQPNFLAKFLCFVAFKPLPYPDHEIKGPDTTNMVEYGKYIVTGKIECWACHSESFKTLNIMSPTETPGYMAGGNPIPDREGHTVYSANLTPDEETGIGKYTEAEFVKAVKYGQRRDGTANRYPMFPMSLMTDYEAKSVYAYLKTLKPVKNKIERTLTATN